ncbi:NPCBM/NEW2 domain-containing protein [Candidatus Soleaferrea massiliensis]|uniref:NPCBM/NEW2 domain-containing protein n=1 Tax=Candidatus Soleaferrea massiliensis TaxID=1470354 RepID=UPI00058F2356|nr:NPCBM/NEW2 domain-containing protein [Candidatus Soleaferrea massiliensis]
MKRTTKIAGTMLAGFLTMAALSAGASAHDNGAAKTPPMGWSSWNAFHANIDEELITETADAMVQFGLRDAGYEYVNLDDNWHASERDENGRLQFDPIRFPHNGKWLSGYIHDRGLKMGLYTSNGLFTCQDLPGSEFHELTDATSFAEWEIDYFKYDYCHNVQLSSGSYGIYGIKLAKPYSPDTPVYSYTAKEAELQGTAKLIDGKYIYGVGLNAGSATFTVEVPEDGTYALNLDFYKKASGTEVPMFIDINGDSVHPYRMMLPATGATGGAPGARASAMLDLKAGENTLRFYNPITNENRNYDTARYNYGFMRDNLMKATAKYAAQNPEKEERPITFSICEWGSTSPWLWGAQTGNLWRTTGDINANWNSVMSIYDVNVNLYRYAGRYGKAEDDFDYGWNDPDMLEVGNGDLTHDENVAHFSLWCMMASPLILGNDLRKLADQQEVVDIITNPDAIAVDQDEKGIQAIKFKDEGDLEYLVKPLSGGRMAVCLFNRSFDAADMEIELASIAGIVQDVDPEYYAFTMKDMKKSLMYDIKDVWTSEEFTDVKVGGTVPSHGVKMYVVEPNTSIDRGAYLMSASNYRYVAQNGSFIVTGRFFNGGNIGIELAVLSLDLPEGFTARPLTSTVGTALTFGDEVIVKWLVTAPDSAKGEMDIGVKTSLLYEGDEARTEMENHVRVTVDVPSPDGPLIKDNWMYATTEEGEIGVNQSASGGALSIGGTVYESGFGVHADSEIAWFLGGRKVKLTGFCGIDDTGNDKSSAAFQVWGDDKKLFDSGTMKLGAAAKELEVDVEGCSLLRLVVTDADDGISGDYGDWCGLELVTNEKEAEVGWKYLDELEWSSATTGWKNEVFVNHNLVNQPLTLWDAQEQKNKIFNHGIFTLTPAEVTYDLEENDIISFSASFGVDDAAKGGNVQFQIYGDRELLFESDYITYYDGIQDTGEIDLSGYKTLHLVANASTGGADWAEWVDAKVQICPDITALIAKAQEKLDAMVAGELNGQYPQAVIDRLQELIDSAKEIWNSENPAATQIIEAYYSLADAIEKLDGSVIVVDKTDLGFAILEGLLRKESDYTAASWKGFAEAAQDAWSVAVSDEVSQKDADQAEKDLLNAIASLIPIGSQMMPGDVNGDGILDDKDLALLKQYITGQVSFTEEQFKAGDVNEDGKINVIDLLNLKLMILNQN